MTANVFSFHIAQPAFWRGLMALSKVCFPSLFIIFLSILQEYETFCLQVWVREITALL